jgi:type II secretory pathway pseudopilin PulG
MKPLSKSKSAGFTLLELLVAMGVTMILLYTAIQVFRDATYSNQTVVQAADMSDNLRAGLNQIQTDLQQAGAGIIVGGIPIPFTPNASGCASTQVINRPVLGGTSTFPACNSTLPAIEPGYMMGPPITAPDASAGTVANPSSITDEITMLYQDNTLLLDNLPVYSAAQCPNGSVSLAGTTLTITFDPNCIDLTTAGIAVSPGDLIQLTDSLGSTVVCVTGVSLGSNSLTFASGDPFALNGRSDTGGTINQMEPTGCGGGNACFTGMLATRVWMITYYLDNITSPPFVRLIRQVNLNSPTPVGETLENLQFTYNFVDGVTNPSNQPTVPAGNSESQIRSVDVYLAARSSYKGHEGNNSLYSRSNLMTQVSLRSMAYVNRYE